MVRGDIFSSVMAGLVPAIHDFLVAELKTWMPGTSGAKTRLALLPGHDEFRYKGRVLPAAFPAKF
jgi:hypothetical protein